MSLELTEALLAKAVLVRREIGDFVSTLSAFKTFLIADFVPFRTVSALESLTLSRRARLLLSLTLCIDTLLRFKFFFLPSFGLSLD